MFVGTHERQLDTKGRLALPAAYRPSFGDRVFLSLGRTGCVDVYSPTEFERMASDLVAKEERGEADHDAVRALLYNAFNTDVDGQGRVNVPTTLREYAGLQPGPVMVAGAYNHLEIWSPEQFAAVNKRGASLRSAGA